MTVFAITSLAGSPGATTTAVGWALHGPRPTLLVEADLTGGSPILAGPFRGSRPHTTSLTALALRPESMSLIDHIWSQAVPLPERTDRKVLPGIAESPQGRTLDAVWAPLAAALRRISEGGGYDVIVDAGRYTHGTSAAPLLTAADVVVVACWAHLPGIHVTSVELGRLRAGLGEVGDTTKVVVLPVTPAAQGYSAREIAPRMAPCPVLPELPWAPTAATAIHQGAPLPTLKRRRAQREVASYGRALEQDLTAARKHATSYAEQIGPAA